jgi:FdhD protein
MDRPDRTAEGAARRTLGDASDDLLIREEPLWIEVDGQRLLTMRTPGRDADLAIGFLLSEGILANAGDVADVRFTSGDPTALRPDSIAVALVRPSDARVQGRLTRTHEIRTSCGLCGLTDPEELLEGLPPILPGVPKLRRADVERLRAEFEREQPLFRATGACHAARLVTRDGAVLGAGEDVGRHNALDKAIGQALRAGHDLSQAVAFLSGRAGFDLVLKCLRSRVPIILSVSAASALSFDLCRAAGATLCGFVRPGRMKVYCDGGRLS